MIYIIKKTEKQPNFQVTSWKVGTKNVTLHIELERSFLHYYDESCFGLRKGRS